MNNLEKIADQLGELTIIEAAELAKILEDKWGVTAAAPVANVQMQAAQEQDKAEEKTEFDVVLTSFGSQKISVIKEVRAVTGLGLKEAKELVESAPAKVKEQVKKEIAEEIKEKIEKAGGKADIK